MSDVGRCPRCHKFPIAEQRETHHCTIPLKGVKEIVLDWIIDGIQNEDEDTVQVAMGLDGFLYRLILCKHNPPHTSRTPSDECLRKDKSDEDLPKPYSIKPKEPLLSLSLPCNNSEYYHGFEGKNFEDIKQLRITHLSSRVTSFAKTIA